jgi:antitoxin FitA
MCYQTHLGEMRTLPALLVRNVEDALVERLKKRAAARGRSVEAEHREILRAALEPATTEDLLALLRACPEPGFMDGVERSRETGRPAEFRDD